MANDFFQDDGNPVQGGSVSSQPIRTSLANIEAGFDKLFGLTGNANKIPKVNSLGTAQTASSITDDGTTVTIAAEVSTSGNVTLTGAGKGVVFEGTTADAFETTLLAGEPTADRTITLPDVTDTLVGIAAAQTLSNKTLVAPALGTPASGILTNCTGLSQAGVAGLTTADSPQFAGLNLGHESDTTLTRVSAGVIAVEGVPVTTFPSGTRLIFQQTAAPTGWTKDTTAALNDSALRIVTGTVGSGGSVAFTTAFASKSVTGTVDSHTLTIDQIPSHTHGNTWKYYPGGGYNLDPVGGTRINQYDYTAATGGGQGHTHPFTGTAINLAVKYNDVIICSKD